MKKWLIVDDDKSFLKMIKNHMRSFGQDVSIADNLVDAQQLVNHQRFDVIMVDILFPCSESGIEFAKRNIDNCTEMYIFTGQINNQLVIQELEKDNIMGINGIILKEKFIHGLEWAGIYGQD